MEKHLLILLLVLFLAGNCAAETDLKYKDDFLLRLVEIVPDLLEAQNPETGRFGKGIWIVNDQHPIFPLAVAWAAKSPKNPYYHDPEVLEAVMKGGDALIEDADENGQWEFRKKDGSTWGKIHMPWTYSRWVRAFGLIRDGMPPDRRKAWENALILGYTGIAKTQLTRPHNIPAHHAMGLYHAGQLFDRQDWREQAKGFMAKVVEHQDPGGFWSENYGPVVGYNFVYTDALGTYYAFSGDESVLPALKRASEFHAMFAYPNGSKVETVDERNPYSLSIPLGNVGFTFSPEGRGYLAHQLELLLSRGSAISADNLASFLAHGAEGQVKPAASAKRDATLLTSDGKAMIRRKGPWFVCLSAYRCPIPTSRWIQDRQNLVSIYHDEVGLIIGGGNTKLQPLWSNFTVGDTALLQHKPGTTSPKFTPDGDLFHVPLAAAIKVTDPPGLLLKYGSEDCSIEVEPLDDSRILIRLRATSQSAEPVAAHLTFLPRLGKPITAEKVAENQLSAEPISLSSQEAGGWIAHAGWKLSLPEGSRVTWPVLPHNPYRRDGSATPGEGRIVVSVPFSAERGECVLTLEVL